MRLFAGVLLPMSRAEGERVCAEALARGLANAGAAWWTGEVHASVFFDPQALAKVLLNQQGVPRPWWEVAGSVQCYGKRAVRDLPKLRQFGIDVVRCLRTSVGRMIESHFARLVFVTEHGPTLEPETATSRARARVPYMPMLRALLEEAVLEASLIDPEPSVEVLIAKAPWLDMAGFNRSGWEKVVQSAAKISHARRHGRPPIVGSVRWTSIEHAPASTNRGLQVADVVAHAVGPSNAHASPPRSAVVAGRTLGHVHQEAARLLGVSAGRVSEHDSLRGHAIIRGAVRDFAHDAAMSRCQQEANELAAGVIGPAGSFPSGREQTRAMVEALACRR